jgi:hypothetical protein
VIVTVKYGRVLDMVAARRCTRCAGRGVERYVPGQCPRCGGTGQHPDGWAYDTGEAVVEVGQLVEVPRTPRSAGPLLATVVGLGAEHSGPHKRILRVLDEAV